MFLGVMLESAICCKLALALVNLSLFSCCFLSLLVAVFKPVLVRDLSGFYACIFGFLSLDLAGPTVYNARGEVVP